MNEAPSRYPSDALAAVILTGIASVMTAGLKPILVTLYITQAGLDVRVAGFVLAAEMLSAALGALLVSTLVVRFGMRRLALFGLVLLLAGDLLCAFPRDVTLLLILRAIAGLGAGFAAGAMACALSGGPLPERNMGLYNGIALTLIAVAFLIIPALAASWGMKAIFIGLAATTVPALALLSRFPDRPLSEGSAPNARMVKIGIAPSFSLTQSLRVLVGIALFYIALGGIWPLMAEIGRSTGLTIFQTSLVLSAAQAAGALGSFSPRFLIGRVKRSSALFFAIVGAIAALGLLLTFDPLIFIIAVPIFIGTAMMFFAYVMGVVATIDPVGRTAGIAIAVQTLCLGAGPAWASVLAANAGYLPLLFVAIGSLLLTLLIIPALARRQESDAAATAETERAK